MLKITNMKLGIDYKEGEIATKISKMLRCDVKDIERINIIKKSKDARNRSNIKWVITLSIEIKNENKYLNIKNVSKLVVKEYEVEKAKSDKRPVIIGSGPAGLFCALVLARSGLKPIVIERGSDVDTRVKVLEEFLNNKKLDENCNVQFGEGGAGTFSDGKLTTGKKDKRINYVLQEFVLAGAPKEILYDSKPHIGTDMLIKVVKNIRNKIIELGGEVRFNNIYVDFNEKNCNIVSVEVVENNRRYIIESDVVILATGHSARDIFEQLNKKGVKMLSKKFSVGVRIEHKQKYIDNVQYGDYKLAKKLGSAEYKMNKHLKNGKGVYTFCMCPGGKVIASQSEKNTVVVNGMSNYLRDSENANSAILVSVDENDFKEELGTTEDNPLNGIYFQRKLEEKAFIAGGSNYNAPYQLVEDLLAGKKSTCYKDVKPSYDLGITPSDINEFLPKVIVESIKEGLISMDRQVKGFASNGGVMTGVETRSSSPVKILRDENYDSSVKGLKVCGEGPGYAGGIMSASIDGIKCAEQVVNKYKI